MVIARAREIFGRQVVPEPEPEPETASLRLVTEPEGAPEATQPRLDEPEPKPSLRRTDGESPVLRLIEQTRAERRAHHDRVAGLFPRPETTEWDVSEVSYDRTRRARIPE